ncbi:hypothetical protein A3D66_01570 [Candidatus Kaiserbacteria bacterium RIFCSPHIGHO2_02_FULL_50_9]|uniref:CYTH domain-containing protein n=1 Tax=Candidatus Kaiserbacteria bacterium RIFCSPLOWO2_01_FULL_51_21 TaxID=1798508 RepID=A0A1F6ED58_9BACT|nr:MAG: hypothetical protein A3D66_01570 [Candidatus Kaiserbacteria bacterium RIFCSPHIGHO2_02_FULL_50_9]OGG71613.1 MAG: hypothetical protein A3A35_00350 [Candidatus Kaiserbacteria bacterium RIFCSPLOWO2_01_FULL_51_21]
MPSCEIEIKSLLGNRERAEKLRRDMQTLDPSAICHTRSKQLNHYFVGGDISKLRATLAHTFSPEDQKKLSDMLERGKDFSIRTRLIDDRNLLFVVKASLDEGSSHNTISRLEFEAPVTGMRIEELDQLLLDAGFRYQAKWSREREEYSYKSATVCLDKNAGYGYLAEFEKVVDDTAEIPLAKQSLEGFMRELGVEELPQERLERMFAYYNSHWPEYYGTDKIFVVQ